MSPEAEIVASLLRWSQETMMIESLRGSTLPGPRAPGCPLGRLIKREDIATAIAIVRDMNGIEQMTEEEVQLEGKLIVNENQSGIKLRTHVEAVEKAEAMVVMLRRYMDKQQQEFMLLATRSPSWKSLETHYPGRDWSSLRDDFDGLSRQLWKSEKFFLSHLVDFVVKAG